MTTLLSRQKTTTEYWLNNEAVVEYVANLLAAPSDLQSITITKRAGYEDSYVFSATSAYWEPVAQTSLSEQQPTSPTHPPVEHSGETLLPPADPRRKEPGSGDVNDQVN